MRPVHLPVSVLEHFYRGGAAIAELRGGPPRCERSPEEWLGSVTTRFGASTDGLSRLPGGTLLRDAVAADPQAWLGPEHRERLGDETALLVKLIDAGERLPVHLHPDRGFAQRHLSCRHGKTEAWMVLDAEPGTTAHVGFSRPVGRGELADLVARQDTDGLLARMHEFTLHPGDAVLVPAGLPHALGAGAFVAEVQEPTDFSILLDWQGFAVDGPVEGHLGLGFDVALEAVRRDALPRSEAEELVRRSALDAPAADRPRALLPAAAAPYFRAELLRPARGLPVPQGFAALLVLDGRGTLRPRTGADVALRRGDALVLPHAAGPHTLNGDLRALLFRPPGPDHGTGSPTP
ncbi:mannose-6-phosphate isomerase [Spinactinospora alkalitolerans]|uniref:Mannose-6-phosphate isomerase n=1 Tax=Spinactinospora alkalitolerans TaxID=687207 RepID=A0A852TXP4_9ACTN|nr:class I mannose-6-phosphate isomerase [Spinactinospora alkalitolerans]NYE48125.1 mannose-6-phosphate isomerase [Spinactinospora alkalitolerans]